MRRPVTRFVSAVSVAGTICAVGAGAAFAAPAATWSGPSKPVPGALTSAAPAVGSYIDPLGRNAVLIVWSGR